MDVDIKGLLEKLDAVRGAIASQTTATGVLTNEVSHNAKDLERLEKTLDKIWEEIKGIHEDKLSKREFDNFKEDLYKPLQDAVKSATTRIMVWSGAAVVVVWLLGIGGPKLLGMIFGGHGP